MAEGTALQNVTWRKDENILEENSRITIHITNELNTMTSQLNIDNVEQLDHGNYSCTAYSEAGSHTRSFFLFVTGKNCIHSTCKLILLYYLPFEQNYLE